MISSAFHGSVLLAGFASSSGVAAFEEGDSAKIKNATAANSEIANLEFRIRCPLWEFVARSKSLRERAGTDYAASETAACKLETRPAATAEKHSRIGADWECVSLFGQPKSAQLRRW